MKSVSFTCQENGSNKEYHLQMVPQGSGFVINFQYGAIGSALRPGTKTSSPVNEVEAEKLFQKLIKERIAKGYTQTYQSFPFGESKGSSFSSEIITEKKTHGIFPQLLNSIDENEVMKYINDDNYLAQEKKDGQRRMAIKGIKSIIGLNKKGEEVQLQNSIVKSIQEEGSYAKDFTIDGEIIGEILHVFDILSINGMSLQGNPVNGRLNVLNTMKFGQNVVIVKTSYTTAEKLKMYNDLKAANAEGIVFKRKDSVYVAGRPSSGGTHLKFKFQKSGTFIVADITKNKRSVGLEMVNNEGKMVRLGKVTIPPNKNIPNIGAFVEVQYLYCFPNGGCIFQPVFLTERDDCDMTDVNINQLVYKADT